MKKIGRFGTPVNAIMITTLLMVVFVLMLSPEGVAKLASAFLLIIFGFLNLAVIVMRESGLHSYDPGFRSPVYPWMQIIGIITSLVLIPGLGLIPRIASGGIILLSILWYLFYAPDSMRDNAMFQIFRQFESDDQDHVDKVLRMGLRERGLRGHDTIDDSFYRATILEHKAWESYENVMHRAVESLAQRMEISEDALHQALDVNEQTGNTPVGNHIALPHARHPDVRTHEIVIVRSEYGFMLESSPEPIYALFILISPEANPGQHLRLLAEIANRAEGIDFAGEWRYWSRREIQSQFIHSEEIEEVIIGSGQIAGRQIRDLDLPDECIIAFIERTGAMVVPHGDTQVERGDKVILLGHEEALAAARKYLGASATEEPV
jgi:mannitol/fructose-specific phosphotransferase system IIA component (Ntr-type)